MKIESRILPKKSVSLLIVCFLILLSSLVEASAKPHEIKIPLGLAWGDGSEKLEAMARPGGFSITHREEISNKTIITVHGLLGTALQENLFFFHNTALIEIEYRYGDSLWKGEGYQEFFNAFRRMYDMKYGSGTQLIHMSSTRKKDIMIDLTGYQWRDPSCILDLYYYSATLAEEHSYRLVSLHYKAP
jgi:hypothetical protein